MSTIFVTKLVIETTSPLAINNGGRETGFDTELARDCNGLPYIPATAIAGVWRHHIADSCGDVMADKWLGSTEQAADVNISHGYCHNSKDTPVKGLVINDDLTTDPILNLLLEERPHHRERVSINDRGVALEHGKFDQLMLPSGVRFSITLHWQNSPRQDGETLSESEWLSLLSLWQKRRFCFGSNTRNGLGQFTIVRANHRCFDLTQGPKIGLACQQFIHDSRISVSKLPFTAIQERPFASLPLQALDNWRCGSGTEQLSKKTSERSVAIITYSEPKIHWKNNQASLSSPQPVLCGSSIKGILRHRMAFHLRRFNQQWSETLADSDHATWQQSPPELEQLFGRISDQQDSLAGSLYVDDACIEYSHTVLRTHNSIDRFTGGVRQGALYSEELLFQPRFTLALWLDNNIDLSDSVKFALQATLEDLQNGLLPMGAGSGRGTSLVQADTHKPWQVDLPLIAMTETQEAEQ